MTEYQKLYEDLAKRLPKDAEGNPVAAGGGQDVWIVGGDGHCEDYDSDIPEGMIRRCMAWARTGGIWYLSVYYRDGKGKRRLSADATWWDGPVYSTRKAAKAARKRSNEATATRSDDANA